MSAENEPLPPSTTRLLREALAAGSASPVSTFLGLPLLVAVAAAGCVAPLVNLPFVLLALPARLGGLPAVALAVVDRRNVSLRRLLDGFRRFERFLGLFWIGYLVTIASLGPLLVGLWVDRRLTPDSARPAVLAISGGLSALLLVVTLHRHLFAFFVAADAPRDAPLQAVLDRAAILLEGRRLAIYARVVGLAAVASLGALLLGYGLLFTVPVAFVALARLYRSLAPLDAARPDAEPEDAISSGP